MAHAKAIDDLRDELANNDEKRLGELAKHSDSHEEKIKSHTEALLVHTTSIDDLRSELASHAEAHDAKWQEHRDHVANEMSTRDKLLAEHREELMGHANAIDASLVEKIAQHAQAHEEKLSAHKEEIFSQIADFILADNPSEGAVKTDSKYEPYSNISSRGFN